MTTRRIKIISSLRSFHGRVREDEDELADLLEKHDSYLFMDEQEKAEYLATMNKPEPMTRDDWAVMAIVLALGLLLVVVAGRALWMQVFGKG